MKLETFEPTEKNVSKIVDRYKSAELPRMERLYEYYNNQHSIENRVMESGKPNNKLAHDYCRYITDTTSGYFMGINVKISSDNEEYLQVYQDLCRDNFDADENFELAKKASIYGYAVEIIYQNEMGQSRYKRIDPREMILIFGAKLEDYLLAAIRFYTVKDLDGNEMEYADVYQPDSILHMMRKAGQSSFEALGEEVHYYGEVPVIIYLNNEEMKGDFENVISIVDSYDKSQSDSANDFEYFTDAYLVFEGYNGLEDEDSDDETVRNNAYKDMRKKRLFYLDKGGKAYFLTKDINDTAIENYKKRLNMDIHKFGMVPDLSDESFAGNLSGVAIEFKLIPLEQHCMVKENKFRTALAKRRELLTRILNIRYGKGWDYREIREDFTRNIPQNIKEETETVAMLDGLISKRTLLELLPQIDDVDQELERLAEEQSILEQNAYPEMPVDAPPGGDVNGENE